MWFSVEDCFYRLLVSSLMITLASSWPLEVLTCLACVLLSFYGSWLLALVLLALLPISSSDSRRDLPHIVDFVTWAMNLHGK